MVEYLGDALGAKFDDVVKALVQFSTNNSPALRQASVYGIGVAAQNCGALFQPAINDSLNALKNSIQIAAPAKDAPGKNKEKQWKHSRDNAISALGKIIRYQSQNIDVNQVVPSWLALMPISTDVEEAKIQASIFVDLLQGSPDLVFGANKERFEHCILIIADILSPKLSDEETRGKLVQILKAMTTDANLQGPF